MKQRTTALCAFLALAATAVPATAQELTERDHKAIGKELGEYLDNLDSTKDQEKAREGLVKALTKIGKKRAGKDGDPVQAALALTQDLGLAVYHATDLKNARGGKIVDGKTSARGVDIEYSAWVPNGYKVSSGPYPLVLVVPGADGSKPSSADQFLQENWIEPEIRDKAILAAVQMPEDLDSWTKFYDSEDRPGGVVAIMLTFREIREQYAVDLDRVYLLGQGTGVVAATSLASLYPHLFAGVAGMAGDTGDVEWNNFGNVPTFFQGAGASAKAFQEGLESAGHSNCTIKPAATAPEIWAWMEEHPRQGNPTKVTLKPGSPIPNKAYWIEVPPTEGSEGKITAEADRATNTVTITSEGIRSVTIYYNDVLLDLDQPVKVVINGQEQQDLIVRSLDDMLSLLVRGTSDPGKLYVASRVYDIGG